MILYQNYSISVTIFFVHLSRLFRHPWYIYPRGADGDESFTTVVDEDYDSHKCESYAKFWCS